MVTTKTFISSLFRIHKNSVNDFKILKESTSLKIDNLIYCMQTLILNHHFVSKLNIITSY